VTERVDPLWRIAAASAQGSAHAEGTVNQDAARTACVVDDDGDAVWIAAVSDGHGGRRYVRSDAGSALAVAVATEHLSHVLERPLGVMSFEDVLRREMPVVVARWRDAVAGHRTVHPFTEAEVARAGAPLDDDDLVAYGATLLVAVVGAAGVGLAQLGDGDALVRSHGYAMRPVPRDPRLTGSETTSLCLEGAEHDFRFAALAESAEPDLVVLATDGYGNSFAETDWWRTVVDDLARFLASHPLEAFEEQFPQWLAESALVGGDDVTAVVLSAGAISAVEPGPQRPGAVTEPPRRRTLRYEDDGGARAASADPKPLPGGSPGL